MIKRLTLLFTAVFALSTFASKAQIALIQNNFTGVIVPQYATPVSADNAATPGKLPIYFRATVSNLLPSTTYNYTIKAVLSATTGVTFGAGDMVHVTSGGTVNFVEDIIQMNQATTQFTTDAAGNYTGWFGLVQNGNAVFTAGGQILPVIHIGDGIGNDPIYSFKMNAGNNITMRAYSNTAGTNVSSIYGESNALAKNFVVLYDNVTASGRPISTTMVESEGMPSTTVNDNPVWYQTNVDGYVGAYTRWGALYVNNGNGVKRIEELSILDGSLQGCATDADGVWPSGVTTIASYNGDATPKFITNTDAPLVGCTSPQDVTGVGFTEECFTTATVNWTKPAGYNNTTSNIIVFAKAGSAITIGTPTNNVTTYTASANFGTGTAYQNDASAFAIYSGDGSTVNLTNLTNNVTYHFLVFNVNSSVNYSGGVAFSGTTLNTEPNNVSGLTVIANNGVLTLDWSAPPGCWDEVLIVAKQGSAVTSAPTGDGTLYTPSSVFADPNLNSNNNLAANEFAVYKGTDTIVAVSELINNLVYHFEIFTRRGTVWSSGITITGTPTAVSGDYQTVQNGDWSDPSTWEFFSGGFWIPATTHPNSTTTNVLIKTGHTVELDLSARQVKTLTLQTGSKLWCNSTGVAYIYVYGGTVINNGQIGNYPTTNDGISFAVETSVGGLTPNGCVFSGSATAANYAISRLVRRNISASTAAARATISANMTITNSGTGITNLDANDKVFEVYVNTGYTVSCLGNISMDGDGPASGGGQKHGTLNISGTLTVQGTSYFNTNNTSASPAGGASSKVIINNGGIYNTNAIYGDASDFGGFLLTANSGSLLNITGTSAFTVLDISGGSYNGYTLQPGSTVEYSATGAQTIQSVLNYQHLTLSGSGNKTPSAITGTVLDIDQNLAINGTAALAPAAGTQINLTGNWTSYGQAGFTEGTSTVYFNSDATQVLNTTGGEVFYNVTKNGSTFFASPAKILLNSDMTVSGVLNLGTGALYAQLDFSTAARSVTLSNMTIADCFVGGANASISMSSNVPHHFYIGCQSPSFTGTMSCSFQSTVHYNRSTGTQTVLGGVNIVYGKLDINNAAGVTLGANVQLINQLIFTSGKVTTGAFYIYVNNPTVTAITGYSNTNYVIGNLRRAIGSSGSFDFPVGTIANYDLAQLISNGLVGTTYVTMTFTSVITGAAPNVVINGVTVNTLLNGGIWIITPDVQPSGGTYGLQLHERGFSNPISPAIGQQGYAGLKRPDSSQPWVSANTVPTSQLASGGTVSLLNDNLTTFSDFGIGYGNAVLPVTLTAFDAVLHGDDVLITWHTESELNNAYFDVETSTDGKTFHKIGSVNGHGTTIEAHSYQLIHVSPVNGVNYYRLKQVDTDNTATYSQIRAVEFFENGSSVVVNVYPVPASSELNVTGVEENALVGVYDLSGKLLVSTIGNGAATLVNLDALSSGLYILKVENANGAHTRLFTKQ